MSRHSSAWPLLLLAAACGGPTAQQNPGDGSGGSDGGDGGDGSDGSDGGDGGDGGDGRDGGATTTTATFKLISYNVQARPFLDDMRAAVNLPIIGGLLGEFGVADVQECFSQCEKLLDAAPQPHHYYFSQPQSIFTLANSGLAGVSWYPIEKLVTTYYQAKAELADTVASKGIALIRITVGGFAVDVYNTHMQAGDSDGAHTAQSAQADELVAFIRANTPDDRAVILHGDFNMGPARPGKPVMDFAPNHYSNQADMLARTANFQKIVDHLGLSDVSDVLFGPVKDHIERVLYRPAKGVSLKPLSWEDRVATFVDAKGAALSDSMPLVVVFAFEKTR